jgi:beta-N-acetylhexosaminidase
LGIAALLAAAALVTMTPQEKAALLVVSGPRAEPGIGGVLVQRWNLAAPRPRGAIVYVDQEGGDIRAFRQLPPRRAAADYGNAEAAFAAGVATARALRRAGVDVDLAPVLDLPDGPLGSRQFRSPLYGIAFGRGLAAGGAGACAKHFPGLGPLPVSTDERPYVRGVLRDRDVAPYREAVEAQLPCVMVGHGVYPSLGPRRALLESTTYGLLRSLGFDGVAITDSLNVLSSADPRKWSVEAVRAGADLVLFTSGRSASLAVRALVPLARRGELDQHVLRVLRFRAFLRR